MKKSEKYTDLTNKKFTRLTAICRTDNNTYEPMWKCQCDCGKIKIVRARNLLSGTTKSCGCLQKEIVKNANTTHGKSNTRLFNIWQNIKRRCYNKNYKYYSYYGGKGIIMCEEWKNSFQAFYEWSIKNDYSDTLTIDRINSDKNYEPSNCRWVNRLVQQNNRKSNHKFTINGETKTIMEWCKIYNVPYERTRRRVVNEHWDIIDALTTPKLNRNGKPI